ncbi:MAG: IS66 family transposase, partial [Gammaproteobacteria bacterium]|nr:IS66 family transposase [Gammaproteobacteria bacterium]
EKLQPLIAILNQKILSSSRIWTDDTILPLQNDDPKRNKIIQARLWVYIGGPRKDPPLVVYDYSKTRSSKWPIEKLKDYRGYKHADGFPGYKALHKNDNVKFVACWAHARRKFHEASLVTQNPGKAQTMLDYIRLLYKVETDCKHMSNKNRKQYRKMHAKPILKHIKAWAEIQVNSVLPKSQLGKALQYLLNHWHGLIRYLDAGHLLPDNNTAEQHIRPVALGRKNYLFVGSDRGGHAAAMFYSLMATCKIYGINPYEYLVDVLTRLPECETGEDYEKLVPGKWTKKRIGH